MTDVSISLPLQVLIFISSATLASWNEASTPQWLFWLAVVPFGFGSSAAITSTLSALIASVRRDEMAVATGSESLLTRFDHRRD